MQRILSIVVGAGFVLATVPVSAQQTAPTGTTRATRAPVAKAAPGAPGAPTPSSFAPRLLPGTRPNVLTTIQGNALSSTNGGLANAMVRLRDARIGRIVDSQISDKSGLFAFKAVDPGSYIVEIMGNDESILAASQMLNVNSGEAISAVVKLPFRIPPFAGLLGNTTPSALAITSAASSAQLLAVQATSEASPSGPNR
jgi:hypothetical protein